MTTLRRWAPRAAAIFASMLALSIGAVVSPAGAMGDGAHGGHGSVCAGLRGWARGLCVAYCTALRCDERPRPGCAVLRAVFVRVTGQAALPCEAVCGDGVINGAVEECDAAGAPCADGQACNGDCTCPPPLCGNGVVDSGEACDPGNAVACADGQVCNMDCTCPPPFCGNGRIDAGEQCDPPGSECAAGDVCSGSCSCPGPNPECAGSACGAFVACNSGTACEDPVCAATAEGGGICIEGSIVCEDLADCATTADCMDGGRCVVETCCGRSVCIPPIATCQPLSLTW